MLHPQFAVQACKGAKQSKAKTILDLGCGPYAPWGSLVRSYLEQEEGRYSKDKSGHVLLTGVDKSELIDKNLASNVDTYVNADILDYVPKLKKNQFDLTILFDVIECLDKKDGRKLLRDLSGKTRYLLLTIARGRRMHFADGIDVKSGMYEFEGKNKFNKVKSEWWEQDQTDIPGFQLMSRQIGDGCSDGICLGIYKSE